MKFYSLLLLFVISFSSLGQQIHHEISMPSPETHYFHVKTTLSDFKEKKLILKMPVWSPGSYLVREYSKNVNQVWAKDEKGRDLAIRKVAKNSWEITKGNAKKVVINYEYYAFELTVRTSFLDASHGYFNGVNLFTYPEGYSSLGGKLTIIPHASFKKISIPLAEEKEGIANDVNAKTYLFEDFDELADTPCEIGNQETFSFDAAGVKHKVAIYGFGNYDVQQLKVDMAKIIEAETKVFGENPNKEYLFIIHNVVNGNGGLEHKNSTTLSVNRWTYGPDDYLGFLSLVAHEYFHVWNVKRLRPAELVKYDYNTENYTDWLWVMEGFTAYYDELILRRAGFYSKEQYLNRFQGTVNWIEGSAGNAVQPVADASYDAWIKAYRPNENSSNTTISYYSKGGIMAGIFDAMIIKNSNGKKSLDDFISTLYQDHYKKKNDGISLNTFKKTLEHFTGENMDSFFEKYIYGTETMAYDKYFKPLGINVLKSDNNKYALGIGTSGSGGTFTITTVRAGSAAEKYGLSPNDEIIAFNGYRVDKSDFNTFLGMLGDGEMFNLIIARDLQLMSIDLKMEKQDLPRYDFIYEGNKLGDFWLRED